MERQAWGWVREAEEEWGWVREGEKEWEEEWGGARLRCPVEAACPFATPADSAIRFDSS